MSATFTPIRMRITTDRYQQMVAAGILTPNDRVELIEGEILAMAPIGTRHAQVTGRLLKRFVPGVGEAGIVRAANPVDLGSFSEPEPDLMILKPQLEEYGAAHPQAADVLLLIEVADSSLAFDQGPKRDLYARYSVREYWVIDVNADRIVSYRQPAQGAFQAVREFRRGETISPEAFPSLQVVLAELFA
ncbi:MAG TPA: Uma2 family endonuclease [Steroidobacteraceae bacterium]|nr:Uma2 family endonuclease [Steroidobacteraceae bacterium]